MLRAFYIKGAVKTVAITETTKPDTVILTVVDKSGRASAHLSRAEFEELASLAKYTSYGNSIEWASKPEQSELPLEDSEPALVPNEF